ncbi:S-type pyocin domain-containing protein [Pseudomonas peradeniyensis]|uniref:S-type pyocin domain-containing protein n=1 Tax=Pseudomonas peradeniyensis TaxID=2745488 RepID=UPI0021D4A720|nr:S-type pyocin domain-containing protein [Pseudomonas peradeniyensis]MCU7281658.1 S-type pyocin domain-containing protein [Pseudomonas peradeniyensis]
MAIELPEIHVYAYPPAYSGRGGGKPMSDPVEDDMIYKSANGFENSHRARVAADYAARLQGIINSVTVEVAKVRADAVANSIIERLQVIKSSLERMMAEIVQKRDQKTVLALAYNGQDPTLYNPIRTQPGFWTRDAYSYKQNTLKWASSYDAFHDAKIYDQAISLIKQHLSAIDTEIQAALAQVAQQAAQAIREGIGGQLSAITAAPRQQLADHAAAATLILSQLSIQVSAEAGTANQQTQQLAGQARQHITALAQLAREQLGPDELNRIVANALAEVEAGVSHFSGVVNSLINEFTGFGQGRQQAIDQVVTEAASQILARQGELNAQVQATPTNDTVVAAQQSLQVFTNGTLTSAKPRIDQEQAAYRVKVDQTQASLQAAQTTLQTELQALPGKVQSAITRVANTYRFPASVSSLISIPGQGAVPVGEAVLSLGNSVARAIAEIGRVAVAGPGAYVATFLALATYSSSTADDAHDRTPDRIRYGLGVNAETLGLSGAHDLNAIAAAQGTVEMPWRLTSEARGDGRSYVSVVNADGVRMSKSVPVRAAKLDLQTGLYTAVVPSLIADQPAITLTWTPASPPGQQSSTSMTPVVPPQVPVYTGVELEPQTVTAEVYPGEVIDVSDLIITFPADSGMEPIYVMFSNYHYHQAPKDLIAFPDAKRVKSKSSVRGGGKTRRRWQDSKGQIYEWDSMHGTVELYNKQGKHLGEFDPVSGNQTQPAIPGRVTQK